MIFNNLLCEDCVYSKRYLVLLFIELQEIVFIH